MGVRGLTTLFMHNPDFFKPCKLHDMRVVIDGDNLRYALYLENKINMIYGGDYNNYAESIKNFFIPFLECNVKPILIFDGGRDPFAKKQASVERTRTKIKEIASLAQNSSECKSVLPILTFEVLKSVLVELDIPFAVCEYEADDQIAAVANHYQCPVISADSDFYIYDVQKGFIRLDSIFNAAVESDTDAEGKECKFLRCDMYHIDDFASCFPGFDKCLFPLFATLMGNDYVEEHEFENFFSNIQLPKYEGKICTSNSRQEKMMGILSWLKNTNLNEAIRQISQYLDEDRCEMVKWFMENAVEHYELHDCNLTRILDQKLYRFDSMLSFDSGLETPCGESLPMDLIIKYHSGRLSSSFVDVVVSHKIYLNPQVEDISCPSSYDCSRRIRQIMYGILVKHSVDNKPCEDSRCISFIGEVDRRGTTFHAEMVKPIFSVHGIRKLPSIDDLCSLNNEESKLILAKALGIMRNFASNVPDEWQLFIACIEYWLWNCAPVATEEFLYALIINLIHFAVIKKNAFLESFASSPKREESVGSSVFSILSKISQNEVQNVERNLKKYSFNPTVSQGSPLQLDILYSYSQLQGVIWSILELNNLLNRCMKNPSPQKCFSGTMLYNLTKGISACSNPEIFCIGTFWQGISFVPII